MDPNITAQRLRERMEEIGADQADVAIGVGCTQGAISQILLGHTRNSRFLPKIADNLGVHLAWLLGTGDQKELPYLRSPEVSADDAAVRLNSVLVPFYDDPYGMGGTYIDRPGEPVEMVPFVKEWLRSRVAGRLDQVMLLAGKGDSMDPTLKDGDIVLVDQSQKVVRDADLIWAFDYGDVGMIKRLRRKPRGAGYVVQSDNKLVEPFNATEDEIRIVGRVISIMQWK